MELTYKLLSEGKEKIEVRKYQNVTLLVGATGTGKSTLAYFMGGDNSELEALEVSPGSGEYIISDTKDKVSYNTTIVSKTIFPEVFYNNEKKMAFVDCPGFSDTRNASMDIVNNYFLKEVTDQARSVKILWTVNYHSVRSSTDRESFLGVLDHATNFLKQLSPFKQSIAMVVTKVDNIVAVNDDGTMAITPDETIKRNVANFLNEVSNSLDQLTHKKDSFTKRARELIDILLTENDGVFNRIWLFRRPIQKGKLSDMPFMQTRKHALEKIVYDELTFALTQPDYFGFSLSPKSHNAVSDLVPQISDKVANIIEEASKVIADSAERAESGLRFLGRGNAFFDQLIALLEPNSIIESDHLKPSSFIGRLTRVSDFLQIEPGFKQNYTEEILKQEGFLNFLEVVSEKNLGVSHFEWENIMNKLNSDFYASSYFYTLSIDLYSSFLKYKMDVKPQLVEGFISKIHSQLLLDEPTTLQDLYPFLINLRDIYNVQEYDRMKNKIINKYQLKCLLSTLKVLIPNADFKSEVSGRSIIFHGNLIQLKDVESQLHSSSFDTLIVLAKRRLLIDTDLHLSGKKVVLAAPTWEVFGKRKIDLNGLTPGDPFPRTTTLFQESGNDGASGLPGLPGGAGGYFAGVGDKFINGNNLYVTLNGGNGGRGQDGEQGKQGAKGQNAVLGDHRDCEVSDLLFTLVYNTGTKFCQFNGKPGFRGGNGGNGGSGGVEGPAGNFKMIESTNKSDINFEAIPGHKGADGQGGMGGSGGFTGDGISGNFEVRQIVIVVTTDWSNIKVFPSSERAESGRHGLPGYNKFGRVDQVSPRTFTVGEQNTILKEYAKYLEEVKEICSSGIDKFILPSCANFDAEKRRKDINQIFNNRPGYQRRSKRRAAFVSVNLQNNMINTSSQFSKTNLNLVGAKDMTIMHDLSEGSMNTSQITFNTSHQLENDSMTSPSNPISHPQTHTTNGLLQLMNLVVKKYLRKGVNSSAPMAVTNNTYNEYAHELAYSYYKPTNKQQ